MTRFSPRLALFSLPGLLLLAALPGCGSDEAPSAPAPRDEILRATFSELPAVPAEERAAYAFDRLVRGPTPLGALIVPKIHKRNLDLAHGDLLALEDEALEILERPETIQRYTGMAGRNADPWDNILRLLMASKGRSVETVLAWTRPVLTLEARTSYALLSRATLRRGAARLLASVRDPRAGETLLALFASDSAEREMGRICQSALVRLGSPWRERALGITIESGSPSLWSDLPALLSSQVPVGEVDPRVSDLLAWWAALVGGSGPRISKELPHLKHLPWAPARLALSPAVPHTPSGARALPGAPVFGPLPAGVAHGTGWYAADLVTQPVFPMYAYILTGKIPAAEGRCALARWRHPTYLASVTADLGLEGLDAGLYWTARHCMAGIDIEIEDAYASLTRQLDRGAPWTPERVDDVRRHASALPGATEPRDWALLERILREMRPVDRCREVLEGAHDVMTTREPDLLALMEEMLRSQDPETRGVALHLMRRSRASIYLDALERWFDETGDEGVRAMLRRTLTWMYSRGLQIEPARFDAFVKRYEGWIADMPDREAAGFVTGLLDFPGAGERAFALGLQGPRRSVYLAGWPRDRRGVSRGVAEAAIALMGRKTSTDEIAWLMALAYASFPASAASALAALRARIPEAARPLVDPALERVRHRAIRPRGS